MTPQREVGAPLGALIGRGRSVVLQFTSAFILSTASAAISRVSGAPCRVRLDTRLLRLSVEADEDKTEDRCDRESRLLSICSRRGPSRDTDTCQWSRTRPRGNATSCRSARHTSSRRAALGHASGTVPCQGSCRDGHTSRRTSTCGNRIAVQHVFDGSSLEFGSGERAPRLGTVMRVGLRGCVPIRTSALHVRVRTNASRTFDPRRHARPGRDHGVVSVAPSWNARSDDSTLGRSRARA